MKRNEIDGKNGGNKNQATASVSKSARLSSSCILSDLINWIDIYGDGKSFSLLYSPLRYLRVCIGSATCHASIHIFRLI